MRRALHNGQRFHRLRRDTSHHAQCRRGLVEEAGVQPGDAGFFGDHRLGQLWSSTRASAKLTDQGIINTFTEHHGGPWTHKDMQHTMMVRVVAIEVTSRS